MGTSFWSLDGNRAKPFSSTAKALAVFLLCLALIWLLTGCANVTVVKLAELCHANEGHPNSTFTTDTGKVDCK